MNSYNLNPVHYQTIYRQAARRVHARLVFRQHVVSFLLGSALLVGIYLMTGRLPGFPTTFWIIWPIAGWAIALLLHFLMAFVFSDYRASTRQRDLLDAEIEKLEGSQK